MSCLEWYSVILLVFWAAWFCTFLSEDEDGDE